MCKVPFKMLLNFVEFSGFSVLAYWFVFKPTAFLYSYLSNRYSRVHERILKPGADFYAVVTGASDGIGLEYARQLAEKGYSLVLLSRTEEKLRKVAEEILEQYPQCKKVETLAVDFSRTDMYDRIKRKLSTLSGTIHVLVNNVGMANHIPEYFTRMPDGFHLRLINTNIVSMTVMSEIVLQIMEKQNHNYGKSVNPVRGVVINISSGLGTSEFPMFNSYSASKAYMIHLSKILSEEHSKDNIIVQCVTANLVKTGLIKDMNDPSLVVNADDFVRYALKTVGTEQVTSGHPKHKLVIGFLGLLGQWLPEWAFMRFKWNTPNGMRRQYFSEIGKSD